VAESDWPVKLGSVTFSEYWLAAANAVDTQTIYIWGLRDGHLMEEKPTPWTIACNLTSLDNWLLIQPARLDPPLDPAIAFDDHIQCVSHVIEIDGRPAVQAFVHYVGDENVCDIDASWLLPAALGENSQPQYCILPNSSSSSTSTSSNKGKRPVELSVYFSAGTSVYWAHLQADPFQSNMTTLRSNCVAATIIKEGNFHVNTPLLGNIMCWPVGANDTIKDEQRVLLLDSYDDKVGQRYFFIRIRTTKGKHHNNNGGGEGEQPPPQQQSNASLSDTNEMVRIYDATINPGINNSNNSNSNNEPGRESTEDGELEIERPTWIAVHSLSSGEVLWERTMRSECRHRLLPLPASKAILCTFDRGALLFGMNEGDVQRVFRADGTRLALHPIHVIGSICMIWPEDGKSVFCVDIRRERVSRRALPSHWPTIQKLTTLASNTSINTNDSNRHSQLAVGTSFLAIVQGDAARWILFNQLLQS
jgi:hypothetical protein